MNVYLDESGDLGWNFDRKYRFGGSSRYLTISCLLIPKEISHLPKRIVKKLYKKKKRRPDQEIKGSDLRSEEKIWFSKKAVDLIKKQPRIRICAITVKKINVQSHIRIDSNKLYNYMVNILLLKRIKKYPAITFIPDPRSIKVKSGNSLVDYLQTKLWFEYNSASIITLQPSESKRNYNLQFIDIVANIVWKKYEDNNSRAYEIIRPKVPSTELFF